MIGNEKRFRQCRCCSDRCSDALPQPLIPRVPGFLARYFDRRRGRALAAGNFRRLAAADFVPGVVGHLQEELGRHHRGDRDYEEGRRNSAALLRPASI